MAIPSTIAVGVRGQVLERLPPMTNLLVITRLPYDVDRKFIICITTINQSILYRPGLAARSNREIILEGTSKRPMASVYRD